MNVSWCGLHPPLDLWPEVQIIQVVLGCLVNIYISSYASVGATADDPSHSFTISVLLHHKT